jgi:kynurenine formamidase
LRFIEHSHQIEAGMTTYPGLPVPSVDVVLEYDESRERYASGTEFFIASLHLCGNTGTYVDAPLHRWRGAADLASLPLRRLAHLEPVLVDCRSSGERGIGPEAIPDTGLAGRAILFHTGFSQHWRTDRYLRTNPFLSEAACRKLVELEVAFVGIDSVNIDDLEDLTRPAHTVLLGAGIPICEHMTNLSALEGVRGRLHAVPIAWKGGATFPVRAYVVAA